MRTFNLVVNNGIATIPTTVAQERVMETLHHKKGFMHIVAYTNAKPLSRAREEDMDIVKITDCMCVCGKPSNVEHNENALHRENYRRLDYNTIELANGEKHITTQLTKNIKHKVAHYYIDLNSGRVYEEDYLVENRYISKPSNNPSNIRRFKTHQIILIK